MNNHRTTKAIPSVLESQTLNISLPPHYRQLFGKRVPFVRLYCASHTSMANQVTLGPEIVLARAGQAMDLVRKACAYDSASNETSLQWAMRQERPFFHDLLAELLIIGPDDLPELLAVPKDTHWQALSTTEYKG